MKMYKEIVENISQACRMLTPAVIVLSAPWLISDIPTSLLMMITGLMATQNESERFLAAYGLRQEKDRVRRLRKANDGLSKALMEKLK